MLARIGGKTRKKIGFASAASAAGLLFALQAIPAARAQVTLDVAKITCGQYTGNRITSSQNIAIWLSGYHHGEREDPTLDTHRLLADAKKLGDDVCMNSQE